ncbi:PTS lactose/cellobiose transporter subunit IIA [Mycoplasma hafezii]|uniref:PTS lactose/cellobiose transporter subunit IIA n=1 Tax=Mycoplasma hafezii TaxID=525886 RepID=UPI003CFAE625
MDNKLEQSCFEIISYAGGSKALFLEAADLALEFRFDEALAKVKEGKELLKQAHKIHAELITMDVRGELPKIPLLLIHAEDQFMSSEDSQTLAQKTIKIMKVIEQKLK